MSAAKTAKFNGWTNCETWAVALWIENDEPSYRYWREAAGWARQQSRDRYNALAERLKGELTDSAPNLGATLWGDLLTFALSEVDWFEIAKNLVDE